MNVLFVTWNGPEVTYIEGLFLPIFEGLAEKYGYKFHIIQFTWGSQDKIDRTKLICESKGVFYKNIRVMRRPPTAGLLKAIYIDSKSVKNYIIANKIDVIMPRATTSAAICINAIKGVRHIKMLFDADGLPQDERVDFGGWSPLGLKYRVYRDYEFLALRKSSAVMTRSHAAKEILAARAGAGFNKDSIYVITNGKKIETEPVVNSVVSKDVVDMKTRGPKLVYAGSMGPQYCLNEMLDIFKHVLDVYPDAMLNILTVNVIFALELVKKRPELKNNIHVSTVSAQEVPIYLQTADFGLALRKPSFSMQAVAPIKLSEYLLNSLPVIATKSIGDTESYLSNSAAAFMLGDMTESNLYEASRWVIETYKNGLGDAKAEARFIGEKYFALSRTVELYSKAFNAI